MQDFLGSVIRSLIPWVIPLFLIASFLVNTKSSDGKSQEGGEKPKESKKSSASNKTSTKETTGVKPQGDSTEAPVLSDKDMTQ